MFTVEYVTICHISSPEPPSEIKDVVVESACTLIFDSIGLPGLLLSYAISIGELQTHQTRMMRHSTPQSGGLFSLPAPSGNLT